MSKKGIYAIYKGDKFIDLGTKEELSKSLNVKPSFITFLATPTNIKRIEQRKNQYENSLISIKIGEENDDTVCKFAK